jgi:hypothetical protein
MNHSPPPIRRNKALVVTPDKKTSLVVRLAKPVTIPLARLKNAIPQHVQEGLGAATQCSARMTWFFLRILSIALVLITAGFYARLYHSPVTMDFLLPTIKTAVTGQLPNLKLNIEGAVLRLGENRRSVEFRLRNVTMVDQNGAEVARAPLASIGVSAAALLHGRVAAGQINLIEPKLVAAYSEESGLALSFSQSRVSASEIDREGKSGQLNVGSTKVEPQEAAEAVANPTPPLNPAEVLTALFERTREQGSATSYLTEFGIKNAAVYFDHGDKLSKLFIPEALIELSHLRKRSVISGAINVEAASVPIRVDFRAEQSLKTNGVAISASVSEVTPAKFATEFGDNEGLRKLNLPIAVSAAADLASNGDVISGNMAVKLGRGAFNAPWEKKHPAHIDSGEFNLTYSRESGSIALVNSHIAWGQSRIAFAGEATRTQKAGGHLWNFDVRAPEMILANEDFGLSPMRVDAFLIQGLYDPAVKSAALNNFLIRAGDASIKIQGKMGLAAGSTGVVLDGTVSPMPMTTVKRIWPTFVAHGARDWVLKNMSTGRVEGAVLKVVLTPEIIAGLKNDGDVPADAVLFKIDLADMTMNHIKGLPPVKAPRGAATVQGRRFVFETGDSFIDLASGAKVHLQGGQFIVGDIRPRIPYGEVHFKASGAISAVEELLDHEPLAYVRKAGFERNRVSGKSAASFSLGMPMSKDLSFKDLTIRGKARADDLRAKGVDGVALQGGALTFDVTEKAIEAQGDLKINGVTAQLAWQRIFDAPPEYQPRIRLRSVLNEKAREDLGVGGLAGIKGDIGAEVSIVMRKDAAPAVSAEIDLSNADVSLKEAGWRKPAGQRAILSFAVEKDGPRSRLANIRLLGDDINVTGSISLNESKKPTSFEFPTIMLSALTKFEARGALSPQNIWRVDVRGASYDGKVMFRSLFSAGQGGDRKTPGKSDFGVDFRAEIGVVHGFFDATIKNVVIDARSRGGRLTALDISGRLNGAAPIAVKLDGKPGQPRLLVAEATDAGAAFRVVGFYPAVRGGEASLRVNLDGGDGDAEKQGRLYVSNFIVVGDQVIDQVTSTTNRPGAAPARRRVNARPAQQAGPQQQIEFNRMTVAFAVGHGQFVLQDSAINGPLLGATIRGRIDFASDTINLSGVYVPLYGINAALSGIPLIGDILSGPRGEGIFGITFAVQGSQSRPDVIVNPMSLITPGFLRGIMEFDHTPPRIIARDTGQSPGAKPRASSQPPITREN